LLQHKHYEVYKEVVSKIHQLASQISGKLKIEIVICDFEYALHKAIKEIMKKFPSVARESLKELTLNSSYPLQMESIRHLIIVSLPSKEKEKPNTSEKVQNCLLELCASAFLNTLSFSRKKSEIEDEKLGIKPSNR